MLEVDSRCRFSPWGERSDGSRGKDCSGTSRSSVLSTTGMACRFIIYSQFVKSFNFICQSGDW
jgi:hypothetical protein